MSPSPSTARAWLVWGLSACAFCYAFFQRVTPSVLVDDLMRDFAVGAAVLGNLSAAYFYPYAGLQMPIGMLVDRFGPRRMLTGALCIAAAGSALFATATSVEQAYVGRLLVGMGSAVGFVGSFALAAHWFPPQRFAMMGGLTMLCGMVGGVGGQGPLALLNARVGWRGALLGAALVAAVIAALIWWLVRDRPGGAPAPIADSRRSIRADLRVVLGSPQNWLIALYAFALSVPLLSYASLWGVPHLMAVYGLNKPAAAASVSLHLLGWALGAPLGGFISDRMARRKPVMMASAGLTLGFWLALLYLPALPLAGSWVLLGCVGAASGAMVACMALARELAPPRVAGTVTGFVNTAAVGAGALMQPVIGLLLDLQWTGALQGGVRVYEPAAFAAAFVTLPACGLIGLLATLWMRESHARPVET